MAKLNDMPDYFNVRPQPKHFAAARPSERQRLVKYIRQYLRACEKQEVQIPFFRRRVNG